MRLLLITSTFIVMLFLTSVASADLLNDCLSICNNKKAMDDNSCPAPDQSNDQNRVECLQNNQDTYNNCLKDCVSKTAPDKPQFTLPNTIITPQPGLTKP
jgi:hypothetical protein